MGHRSFNHSEAVKTANHDALSSVVGSYQPLHISFRGFSAMLKPDQAEKLAESDSVVSVFESKLKKIHTTHSWEFLGAETYHGSSRLPLDTKYDVIVGMIDSGIRPESISFNDHGLSDVPLKFKGECVTGDNFTLSNCNRKIIGARYYSKGFEQDKGSLESYNSTFYLSARDSGGHGTHTASTVAGSLVPNVSVLGQANGTARGGAPSARLAIYKVCWFGSCSDADLLSAIDDAISDGVDVISSSIGSLPPQTSYFQDTISIGSFHAFQKGIVFSAAGYGINPTELNNGFFELIFGRDAAAPGVPAMNASFCKNNTLDPLLIKGKIVLCKIEALDDDRREKGSAIQEEGGVGMILVDPLTVENLLQHAIKVAAVAPKEAEEVQENISSNKQPVARIQQTVTVLSTKPAPKIASFSSRGPNIVTPDIIKPDITAPGVNILAAWSPVGTQGTAGRSLDYNIIFGTSMSCPHVSAVAAIVKSYHPSWSPAAIKSAIMTTATFLDNERTNIRSNPNDTQASPFDYGSGHINPVAAIDPGLIYDYNTNDIINLLCSTGAIPDQLKNLTGQIEHCKTSPNPSYDFNYPSIGVSHVHENVSVHRTVTYHGKGSNLFIAKIDKPKGVRLSVTPIKLKFSKTGQKKRFTVHFEAYETTNGSYVFGSLTWIDGIHKVRSPIALNVLSV
ncbi:serine protease [Lithospermum erythrorhizon]|uniref:Serine protease n=1 Tax=Lithospermum erythrorhizon TaxID=34254 RepID=A0AAV3RVI7_LITER